MTTTKGNRVRKAIGTLTLTGAAMGFMSACGAEGDDDTVYCVDQQNNVVDDDRCDDNGSGGGDGGGAFFFIVGNFGGNSYGPGQQIPRQYTSSSSGNRVVPSNNPSARADAGLPRTGSVVSGSRVGGGIGGGTGTGS